MQRRLRIALIGIAAAAAGFALTARAQAESTAAARDVALLVQPSASASPDAKSKAKRMVSRIWHGRTLTTKADDFEKYVQATAVKKILATPGNHGVEVLRRTDGPKTDFIVMSYWESMDAVKRFAGADYQKAVVMPRDAEFLIEVDPGVAHYEVVRAGGK